MNTRSLLIGAALGVGALMLLRRNAAAGQGTTTQPGPRNDAAGPRLPAMPSMPAMPGMPSMAAPNMPRWTMPAMPAMGYAETPAIGIPRPPVNIAGFAAPAAPGVGAGSEFSGLSALWMQ